MNSAVLIFAPHWGSAHLSREAFIGVVLEAGFDGIEMSLPMDLAERDAWTAAIEDAGLQLIAGLQDTAFKKALAAVPTLKTGRPAKD